MLTRLLQGCCIFGSVGCNSATISLLPEGVAHEEAGLGDAPSAPVAIGEWKLDSDATDSGAGDNNGMLLGGAAFAKDPVRGDVLLCNGTDGAVRIANRAGTSFTYAAWIWSNTPSSKGSGAIDGDGVLWSNVAPAQDDFVLAVLNDRIAYMNYNLSSTGTTVVDDATWHHVAVTRQDGARVALYVDGKVDGEGSAGTGDVAGNPYVFFCGANLNGGHYFTGAMDDVRQYDRVLSPGEIETVYTISR